MTLNAYLLRDANEIGVTCANANDRTACGRWTTMSCGGRFVDASRTRLFRYQWTVADRSTYTEPDARANHREMHDEERKRHALRRC